LLFSPAKLIEHLVFRALNAEDPTRYIQLAKEKLDSEDCQMYDELEPSFQIKSLQTPAGIVSLAAAKITQRRFSAA
jgi:hypothetical protein